MQFWGNFNPKQTIYIIRLEISFQPGLKTSTLIWTLRNMLTLEQKLKLLRCFIPLISGPLRKPQTTPLRDQGL